MRINLKRNWFTPDGQRLRKIDNPHEVTDEWKGILPEGAEIVDEVEDEGKKNTPPRVHKPTKVEL